MNGDPYRTSQSNDRRVINRSGQAPQRADEPQPVREEPMSAPPVSRQSSSRHTPEKKSKKGLVWGLIILLVVLAVGAIGWSVWSSQNKSETGIDSSRYQAVFMSNGQIYFGKLSPFNDVSFKITDIYYPQAQTTGEDDTKTDVNSEQSNIQLFRVTDGVHGPEDQMIIMKSQILYYENLEDDSKVTQLIEQNNK